MPKTLAVTAGNAQSGPIGVVLPIPLSVLVTGSDDRPFQGATVTWAVIEGTASLSSASSTTDAQGSATTSLTLSNQVGPVTVRASVTDLTPVVFTATAFDPCAMLTPYTLGSTVSGTLARTDCRVTAGSEFFYTDFYSLDVQTQQGLTVAMSSTAFDTYLELYKRSGEFVGFNDDSVAGVYQNSRLHTIVAPGSYVFASSSWDPDTIGAYDVSAVTRDQPLAGCRLVWVTRGIIVADNVTRSDCLADTTQTGDSSFADAVAIVAAQNSVLTIAERSTAFNALLTLFNVDQSGNLIEVASNDDSASAGTTTNAYLVATVPATDIYILFIGTAGANETGAYTLAISASTTAQGARVAARERLPFGSYRWAWPGRKGTLPRFLRTR